MSVGEINKINLPQVLPQGKANYPTKYLSPEPNSSYLNASRTLLQNAICSNNVQADE